MSHQNLLSSNRREFVRKIYYEIHNDASSSITSDIMIHQISTRYSETCISLHLQELFNIWTSDDDIIIIDNFIQEC